jgi:hypothetical protein
LLCFVIFSGSVFWYFAFSFFFPFFFSIIEDVKSPVTYTTGLVAWYWKFRHVVSDYRQVFFFIKCLCLVQLIIGFENGHSKFNKNSICFPHFENLFNYIYVMISHGNLVKYLSDILIVYTYFFFTLI